MKRLLSLLLLCTTALLPALAQPQGLGKLSPWLRQLMRQEKVLPSHRALSAQDAPDPRQVCAFIQISGNADAVLNQYHSRLLTSAGSIHIANIPLSQLNSLAQDERVRRIEARPRGDILLDTLRRYMNVLPAHEGRNLPQAFTGKGVVLGSMDVGFDLTHPNFYTKDVSESRIKCLWDMLSTDTIGSRFPVGRDYVGQEELLALGHSRDGLQLSHGTHTLGIATGNGYDSNFQGVAPECDICLVANAVTSNSNLIDSTLHNRFTFATDALGFKYLFDAAKKEGKPCVVTFSEGSSQDYMGYDLLYYAMLDSLLGPGRIMVAAAGNNGHLKSWFRKERNETSKGAFIVGGQTAYCTLKSADEFTLRLVAHSEKSANDSLVIKSSEILADSSFCRRYHLQGVDSVEIQAYPSCYAPDDMCYDVSFYSKSAFGFRFPLSLELLGEQAEVELWRGNATLTVNRMNVALNAGETTHNVHSPSSAPRIISVGATTYRDSIQNLKGEWHSYWLGNHGSRVEFSSVGPTMDGRTKPDVMAPGNNIISSYSSFYKESHPASSDFDWEVKTYDFKGRTYSWTSNSGTSSSCPAVAGAIALWLQARPDLSPEDVLNVIQQTSRHPDPSLTYPNNEYGYGEIDVYRGLLYILGADQIEELSTCHTQAQISLTDGRLRLSLPEATSSPLQVRVFSLSGLLMGSHRWPAGQAVYEIPIASLAAGVYAIQIDGASLAKGSTLIRL